MHDHNHDHTTEDLTKNQALVLETLTGSKGPLSAYTILDQVRDQGIRAPLQVYRALDNLVAFGMVHRLESLKAFLACRNPNCGPHTAAAFTICDVCGRVAELTDGRLTEHLESVAQASNFTPTSTTIELRGVCDRCHKE